MMQRLMSVLVGVAFCAGVVLADWQEPKDGKLTEKQVTGYIGVLKELVDLHKAAGKAIDKASGPAAMAIVMRTGEKYDAIVKKHGLNDAEMNWVSGKVFEAYGAAEMEILLTEGAQADLAKAGKESDKELADAKARLAAHEAALKDGRRIIDKEEREQIIADAREEQKSAEEEAKEYAKEAKETLAEAARATDPDEKQDARDRAAEAQQNEKEARARATVAARRIASPDLPANDEEKAELIVEHQRQIARAKDDIKQAEEAAKLIGESSQQTNQLLAEMRKSIPAENIALMKKHAKAFKQALGIEEEKAE
jgi:hypothetical protein